MSRNTEHGPREGTDYREYVHGEVEDYDNLDARHTIYEDASTKKNGPSTSDYESLEADHAIYEDISIMKKEPLMTSKEDMYTLSEDEDLYEPLTIQSPQDLNQVPDFASLSEESNYYSVTYDDNGHATLQLDSNETQKTPVDSTTDDLYEAPVPLIQQDNIYRGDSIHKRHDRHSPHSSTASLPTSASDTRTSDLYEDITLDMDKMRLNGNRDLPPDWTRGTTPDGKTYFINHRTKTTSWIKPLPEYNLPKIGDYVPLPNGWEFVPTPKPHFLDHNLRLSHLEDPRPLPKGWGQMVRKEDGRCFFVDYANKVTTWEYPCSDKSDKIEVKRDASGKTYYVNHTKRETSWSDPRLAPNFFGVRGQGLPAGVEKRLDCSGKPFYLDHRTKKSTWEPPTH